MASKDTSANRHYLVIAGLAIAGVMALLLALLLPSPWAGILNAAGSTLAGAALIDALLTIRFQWSIKEQVSRMDSSIADLQKTVAIASGAVESGLTAVYDARGEALDKIDEALRRIIDEAKLARNAPRRLQRRGKGKKDEDTTIAVKMLGISLGDFLCPHGRLQGTFRELIKVKRCSIDIIVLKDHSRSAYRRAFREEQGKFTTDDRGPLDYDPNNPSDMFTDSYSRTKCHDELKTATDYLRDLLERKSIDRDRPNKDKKVEAKLKVYEYDYDPMAFVFMIENDMFVENYHLAGRGGEAPILRVTKAMRQAVGTTSKLYEIYDGHFEAMRSLSAQMPEGPSPKLTPGTDTPE